jgi:hypothetical protein
MYDVKHKGEIHMKKILIALILVIGFTGSSILYAANLHGVVTGKDGKPASVEVVLIDAKDAPVGEPAATDKDGAYTFKDIKPGNYTVTIGEKKDNNEWKFFVGPGETRRDFTLK